MNECVCAETGETKPSPILKDCRQNQALDFRAAGNFHDFLSSQEKIFRDSESPN
jgi:hypothetical protein